MSDPIITDVAVLRQVSKPVEGGYLIKAQALFDALPENALGLSACQIGEFDRMFVAKINSRTFVFVNPVLSKHSEQKFASEEGCLSVPGVTRCVERCQQVAIKADSIIEIKDNRLEELSSNKMLVEWIDAAVVQHEYDHLEGGLIIDLPEVKTRAQRYKEKAGKREQKVKARRHKRRLESKIIAPQRINPKRKAKLDKMAKQAARNRKKRVKIEEERKAMAKGIEDFNVSDA